MEKIINKINVDGDLYNISLTNDAIETSGNTGVKLVVDDNSGKLHVENERVVHEYNNENTINMNNFTEEGLYKFTITNRTNDSSVDNLPIENTGGGHNVEGDLTVQKCFLNENEYVIGQKLLLTNRLGDTKEYTRQYRKEVTTSAWTPWLTTVTMQEVGELSSRTDFDNYTSNGLYNGYNVGSGELFLLVVMKISDETMGVYVSQLKYGFKLRTNEVTVSTRTWTDKSNTWSDWSALKYEEPTT